MNMRHIITTAAAVTCLLAGSIPVYAGTGIEEQKKEVARLEQEVKACEDSIASVEAVFRDERLDEYLSTYGNEIVSKNTEWAALAEKLEKTERDIDAKQEVLSKASQELTQAESALYELEVFSTEEEDEQRLSDLLDGGKVSAEEKTAQNEARMAAIREQIETLRSTPYDTDTIAALQSELDTLAAQNEEITRLSVTIPNARERHRKAEKAYENAVRDMDACTQSRDSLAEELGRMEVAIIKADAEKRIAGQKAELARLKTALEAAKTELGRLEGQAGTAMPVSGRTYMILSAKNRAFALDIAGGSRKARANAAIYTANGTEAQCFTFTALGDGSWQIRNYKGMVLDICGASRNNGANLQTYSWNASGAQRFVIKPNSDGTVCIVNRNSGKAIDISGGVMRNSRNVQQYSCNGTDAQKWVLVDVSDKVSRKSFEGNYVIRSRKDRSYCADIVGASKSAGANLQLYKANGTQAQVFAFSYVGDGFYKISNVRSGLVLTAASASRGANVTQESWTGSSLQLWKPVTRSGGAVSLVTSGGYVLDLSGGVTALRRNIRVYDANGTAAQDWLLDRAA